MENRETVIAVILDFKRAFETVIRQILLEKLSAYCLKSTVLLWFTLYLWNLTGLCGHV